MAAEQAYSENTTTLWNRFEDSGEVVKPKGLGSSHRRVKSMDFTAHQLLVTTVSIAYGRSSRHGSRNERFYLYIYTHGWLICLLCDSTVTKH